MVFDGAGGNDIRVGRRVFFYFGMERFFLFLQFLGADFVGFGQDNLVSDGGFVKHFHNFFINLFQAVTGIYQQKNAFKIYTAAQIIKNELLPLFDQLFRSFGIAVAGEVDNVDGIVEVKIV